MVATLLTGASATARPIDEAKVAARHSMRGLVAAHYRFLWRSLRRLGVPQAQVEDAAQRVLCVAARKLLKIAPGSERAFLFRTAWRVAAELRRARASRILEVSDDEAQQMARDARPTPEEQLEVARARLLLDQVLDSLPFDLRTVLVLVELEELTLPQAAEMLEIPLGTATSRLRRARQLFEAAAKRVRLREENAR